MSHPPAFMTMLHDIISSPSVSCTQPHWDQSNLGVIELLEQWFSDLGFSCEVLPVKDTPGKANLIATLGSGPGGLVLAGHTDTVPFNESQWNKNPLQAREDSNKVFGLGTSDMKSFFPIIAEACRELEAKHLTAPVIVLATADEESTMSGARDLVRMGRPKARAAIIGEPTDMVPVRAHKGILMESILVEGHGGHSSDPAQGNSALEAMNQLMTRLLEWRTSMQERFNNPVFKVPVPTMNLGCIHGGDNPNRICDHCELQIDLRPLPGMNPEDLRNELRAVCNEAAARLDVKITMSSLFPGARPMETPVDSEIITLAKSITGMDSEAVAFCTEGPYLAELGADVLVWGPGSVDQAHQPDEFLTMDRIQPCIDQLKQFIRHYCL